MSGLAHVRGVGVVSPAGWGVEPFWETCVRGVPLATTTVLSPGGREFRVRKAPVPATRPVVLQHARLRRSGRISQFACAASFEALGGVVPLGARKEGFALLVCLMAGCVDYSRRFFDEVLHDAATASPLLFPETVFNAPASHAASILGIEGMADTILGDDGVFLNGLTLAAEWIEDGAARDVLVVSAEEADGLTSYAGACFSRRVALSEGSAAVWLSREPGDEPGVVLSRVTSPALYAGHGSRAGAGRRMKESLLGREVGNGGRTLLISSDGGWPAVDRADRGLWQDWQGARMSPRSALGEALSVSAGWQCVAAIEAIRHGNFRESYTAVLGAHDQAIGAKWAAR